MQEGGRCPLVVTVHTRRDALGLLPHDEDPLVHDEMIWDKTGGKGYHPSAPVTHREHRATKQGDRNKQNISTQKQTKSHLLEIPFKLANVGFVHDHPCAGVS